MKSMLMVALLLLTAMLNGTLLLHAQQNSGFTYQAVARDSSGTLQINSTVNLRFEIFEGVPNSGGTKVYDQDYANQPTNAFGLVNLVIGENDILFDTIDWSLGPHYCVVHLNGRVVDTYPFSSVPYSKFSEMSERVLVDEVEDADADPSNEAQTLTKSGSTVTLSAVNGNGGGSFTDAVDDADPDPNNETQTLSKSGNTVTLSAVNGNGGGSFTDAVNDADSDPTNELQGLTIVGNTLSLSNNAASTSVSLPIPTYTAGTGISIAGNTISNTAPSTWTLNGANVYRSAGSVGIGTASPATTLDVRGSVNLRTQLKLLTTSGQNRVMHKVATVGYGYGDYYGGNGSINVRLGGRSNTTTGINLGKLSVYDDAGNIRGSFMSEESTWNGAGRVLIYGANNSTNVELGVDAFDTNGLSRGAIRIRDENGNIRVRLGVDAQGRGTFIAYGSTGSPGGGIKNFSMPHPTREDKQIVYACIEGPEAAAYERGTVELVNGMAEVQFSEHFEIVANPTSMTVMTSPWSEDSQGLAVVERTASGFIIKELNGGTGSYKVDWEVKAVRKGWEDYEAIRDWEPDHFVSPTNE